MSLPKQTGQPVNRRRSGTKETFGGTTANAGGEGKKLSITKLNP